MIDQAGNDFLDLGRSIAELGRRQQVAQRRARIERRHRNFEIAPARRRNTTGGRLNFLADQQRGEVGHRNLDSVEHQLRHEHRAVGDYHLGAVGQVNDQVAPDHVNVGQLDSGRKHHGAIGAGNDDLGVVGLALLVAEADDEARIAVVAGLVGQRVSEDVGAAVIGTGMGNIAVGAMGIDRQRAIAAGDVETATRQVAGGSAGPRDGGYHRFAVADVVGTSGAADGAGTSDGVADGRAVRAGGNDVQIVVSGELRAPVLTTNHTRVRKIVVAHNPPLRWSRRVLPPDIFPRRCVELPP